MKKKNILKRAGILLIAVALVFSSTAAIANTEKYLELEVDVECKEVWLGYESDNPRPLLMADVWLGFDDGSAEGSVGTDNPPIWGAIHMDNVELAPYDGWELEEIRWFEFYFEPDMYPTHTVYYIIAEGNATAPITEMVNESETTTNVSDWKNYNFTTTYTIDAFTDLWIIVWVSDAGPEPDDAPVGYDTNPASYVANKSAMFADAVDPYPTFFDFGTVRAGACLINVRVVAPPGPVLSVSIAGGFGLTATITNSGDVDATNVKADFTITGGFFLLPPGGSKSVAVGTISKEGGTGMAKCMVLGFGKPTVTVDVTCTEGATASATYTPTFVILFFVL